MAVIAWDLRRKFNVGEYNSAGTKGAVNTSLLVDAEKQKIATRL